MKTIQEIIEFHSQQAAKAISSRKRQQHQAMRTILEAFQLDLKKTKAKLWAKQ